MRFIRRYGFFIVLFLLTIIAFSSATVFGLPEAYAYVAGFVGFIWLMAHCHELQRVERAMRFQKRLPEILEALRAGWFSRINAIFVLNEACGRHYGTPVAPRRVARAADLWANWLVENYDRLVWDDELRQWVCTMRDDAEVESDREVVEHG